MRTLPLFSITFAALMLLPGAFNSNPVFGQPDWVQFTNETATRISANAQISTSDPEEKDYIWGDVDNDGDGGDGGDGGTDAATETDAKADAANAAAGGGGGDGGGGQ